MPKKNVFIKVSNISHLECYIDKMQAWMREVKKLLRRM